MNQQDFFGKVLSSLERLRIPHILTESVAAMLYGEQRLTNDMDVVAGLPVMVTKRLIEAFPPDEKHKSF